MHRRDAMHSLKIFDIDHHCCDKFIGEQNVHSGCLNYFFPNNGLLVRQEKRAGRPALQIHFFQL